MATCGNWMARRVVSIRRCVAIRRMDEHPYGEWNLLRSLNDQELHGRGTFRGYGEDPSLYGVTKVS